MLSITPTIKLSTMSLILIPIEPFLYYLSLGSICIEPSGPFFQGLIIVNLKNIHATHIYLET